MVWKVQTSALVRTSYRGVERDDALAAADNVQAPVNNEWVGDRGAFAKFVRPGDLKLADIASIDLVQRRVMRCAGPAFVAWPIGASAIIGRVAWAACRNEKSQGDRAERGGARSPQQEIPRRNCFRSEANARLGASTLHFGVRSKARA